MPSVASPIAARQAASFDRHLFLRPIAHRGLHSRAKGLIENSAPAFQAAIDKGYGIECDLQAAKDGAPMVFHDERLDRLVAASGRISERSSAALARLTYRHQSTGILRFEQLLELVRERVPLLVEVKRNKHSPPRAFLERIAAQAALYKGPLGLMSFDRDIVTLLSRLAPGVARGWVVGRHQLAARWWAAPPTARKHAAVARLLSSAPGEIAFLAVDVKLIKSARGFLAARAIDLPLFSWTIRTRRERAAAARFADAPIFEGYEA